MWWILLVVSLRSLSCQICCMLAGMLFVVVVVVAWFALFFFFFSFFLPFFHSVFLLSRCCCSSSRSSHGCVFLFFPVVLNVYFFSILYKTKLPFIIAFNKTDVLSHQFCIDWMKDFEAFQVCSSLTVVSLPVSSHPCLCCWFFLFKSHIFVVELVWYFFLRFLWVCFFCFVLIVFLIFFVRKRCQVTNHTSTHSLALWALCLKNFTTT